MTDRPLTQDEILIAETLLDKVAIFEIFLSEQDYKYEIRDYQAKILLDESRFVSWRAARGVGKTKTIEAEMISLLFRQFHGEVLVAAPNAAHLKPLFDRIINKFYEDPFLKSFIDRCIRAPEYMIRFKTGLVMYGRIAGLSGGVSLLGIHANYILVEESQNFGPQATNVIQGCINPNGKVRVFGCPNGVRTSYLFKADTSDEFVHYKTSKFEDPTYTEEEDLKKREIFGGENSQSYINQVKGEWGITQFSTFGEKWAECLKDIENYEPIIIEGSEKIEMDQLPLPPLPVETEKCVIAADVGYSPDPTVLGVLAKLKNGVWRLFCKIIMKSVSYTGQEFSQKQVFDYVANFYNISEILIDSGGPGKALYLDLKELSKDRSYEVYPVEFGGSVVIGYKEDGKPVKERVKYYSTLMLQEAFNKKIIELPRTDFELIDEIQSSTQTRTASGNFVYSGKDHHIDMLRCWAIRDHIDRGETYKPEPLISFIDLEEEL